MAISSTGKSRTLRVHVVGENKGLKKTLDSSEREIEGFGGRIRRRAGQLGKAIGAAALGAAVAVAAGVVASVRAFASFDDAMTKSLAIMGDVSGAMRGKMSAAAREVGKTTSFSATEAAEAYFFLASAGLSAEQQIAAMPRVAKFAQAGNFDLARATDLATDAQSALGLSSEDAAENLTNLTRVTDVLIKANQNANASAEQFSEALTEKAGAALRSLNKDVEEGVAVLSVFADQGIKGTAAGTALTSTLEGLTRNARNNADAFAKLGVRVFDTDGSMRNMADIVGDLERGLDGMSVEQREAAISQLGFTRQARDGILALLGSSEAVRDYEASLRDAGGAVDDVAGKQLKSFSAQLGLLKDRAVDVAIEIGGRVTPHLQRAAEWLNANGDAIADRVVGALDNMVGWWDRNGPTLVRWITTAKDTAHDLAEGISAGWTAVRDTTAPAVSWLGGQLRNVGEWFGITRRTVADETAAMAGEAVGAAVGMVTAMTDQARMLAHDGQVLSGELADTWIANVNRLRDETVAAAEQQREDLSAIAQELYETLDSVTAEQAGAVIKNANTQADESVAAAERQAELVVNQIQIARDRGEEISQEQAERIVLAAERQRDGAVAVLADQAHQTEVVLAQLAAETGKVSLEAASAAIAESARRRDEVVAAAEAEYQGVVSNIIRMRDESDVITEEMANEHIAEATRMRDETVNAATLQHFSVVGEIARMREGVVNETNLMTGEVLSGWDRFVADVAVPLHTYRTVAGEINRRVWSMLGQMHATGWALLRTGWETNAGNIQTIFGGLRDAAQRVLVVGMLGNLRAAFTTIPAGILGGLRAWASNTATTMAGLANRVMAPVNAIIGGVNRVSDMLGRPLNIPLLVLPTGGGGGADRHVGVATGTLAGARHRGGVVGEAGGDRLGRSGPLWPDEQLVLARRGEEVLTADDPRHRDHARDHAESGGLPLAAARDVASRVAVAVADRLRSAAGSLVDSLTGPVRRALDSVGTPAGRVMGAAGHKALDTAVDWIRGVRDAAPTAAPGPALGNAAVDMSGGTIAALIRIASAVPHRVTSTFRPKSKTYHGLRRAVDFADPAGSRPRGSPAMMRIFQTFLAHAGRLKELFYTPAGFSIKNGARTRPIAASTHYNHVHAAMRAGGRVTAGGLAMVGEDGPEVADLPRGAQVTPVSDMQRLVELVEEQNRLLTGLLAAAADRGDTPPPVLAVDGVELARVIGGPVAEELRVREASR